ncbi:hypothetical protein [Corynebacterium sp. A21]|uniref:hypothetical protein n=1 Tax=Corynebacterium sp. A21 TaxID=3457318 RepID=UPI003FD56041
MSIFTKRAAAIIAAAAVVASGIAVAGAGTASARTCHFDRQGEPGPKVSSAGPIQLGVATGDCSFINFGEAFSAGTASTGLIGVLNIPVGDEWFVIAVEDLVGVTASSDNNEVYNKDE